MHVHRLARAFSTRRPLCSPPTRLPRMLPQFSLENKVCVVTGGAGGLGYEFCSTFLEVGCTNLAVVDLAREDAIRAAKELVDHACSVLPDASPSDYHVIGIGCNISKEPAVAAAFQEIKDTFGRIDALVASAGVVDNKTAFEYPVDELQWLFGINVFGAFYCAREAAKHMVGQGGGSITLVGSMSGTVVNLPQTQTPYNASKAAVRHMASSLGVEWGKDNIRVNVLSPGYMRTKLTDDVLSMDTDLNDTWEEMTPMGRIGQPSELAGAIVLLSSDASSYMTGAELQIDGGYCARSVGPRLKKEVAKPPPLPKGYMGDAAYVKGANEPGTA